MDTVNRVSYVQGSPAPYQASQPQAPPPSYFAAVRRRVPGSLRTVLLVATFISFIYLVSASVTSFRYVGSKYETTKLKIFDIIIGVFLVLGAVTEAFGFWAVWTRKQTLVAAYARVSIIALAIVVAAQIVNVISHFTGKGDITVGCTKKYTGANACSGYSSWWGGWSCSETEPLNAIDAASYCEQIWKKESVWVFVWLAIILVLGGVFVSLAFGFFRQIQDPSWRSRQGQTGPSAAYSSAFTYDDESSPFDARGPGAQGRYSYEDDARYFGATGAPHSYPPPPGAPPGDDEAPRYEAPAGRKTMASVDLDRKDPNLTGFSSYAADEGAAYQYENERPAYNPPESSRSVYYGQERPGADGAGIRAVRARQNSEDTVKDAAEGDATHAKV